MLIQKSTWMAILRVLTSVMTVILVLCGMALMGTVTAADIQSVTVTRYYEKASEVNDPALPEGLKVTRWGDESGFRGGPPMITTECLRFGAGEFSRALLNPPHGRRIGELFVEAGVDLSKLTNLVRKHSAQGNEIVSVFDEGYLMLFDPNEKANYIFPIGKGMGQKLFNLGQ
jgi:hypothetical protein